MHEPVLCYVKHGWAYFTTQPLEKQWGDDWNNAPYEHKAEEPYLPHTKDEFWQIIRLGYSGPLATPAQNIAWDKGQVDSGISVHDINDKKVPWLTPTDKAMEHFAIYAGDTATDFVNKVLHVGGMVYSPVRPQRWFGLPSMPEHPLDARLKEVKIPVHFWLHAELKPAPGVPKAAFEISTVLTKHLEADEVVCDVCGGTGLVIDDNKYAMDKLDMANPFPYRKEDLRHCPYCYSGVQKVCPHCGAHVRSLAQHNCPGMDAQRQAEWQAKAAEKAAKAELITVEEATKRGIKYFWDTHCDALRELDMLGEFACDHPESLIRGGAWAAIQTACLSFNAADLIENACEDLWEDAIECISSNAIEELQALLNVWAAKIEGTETFEPSNTVIILVPDMPPEEEDEEEHA